MKKIICMLLCLATVFALVPFTIASAEDSIELKVAADRDTAAIGDTITYTVSISSVKLLNSGEFKLVIPEGLTYVKGSGKAADGLAAKLGADKAELTESSLKFVIYGDGAYTSEAETVLMTFQCTVDAGASGTYRIGLTKIDFGDFDETRDIEPEDLRWGVIPYTTCLDTSSVTIVGGQQPEEKAEFTVTPSVNSVKAGEDVTFTVKFSGSDYVRMMAFGALYDEKAFTLKDMTWLVDLANVSVYYENDDGDGVASFQYDAETKMEEQNVLTFTLTAKADAAVGDYTVSVETSLQRNKSVEIPNTVTGAKVSITKDEPEQKLSGKAVITADKQNAKAGDEIVYTINLSDVDAADGISFTLGFDDAVLEYVSSKWNIKGFRNGYEPKAKLLFMALNDVSNANGDIVTVTFKVKDGAVAGTTTFTVTPNITNDVDMYEMEVTPATVTITSAFNGVKLSAESLDLDVNGTKTLTYTLDPIDIVPTSAVWSSTNSNVVTVDPSTGLVTAVAPGQAKIKLTVVYNGASTVAECDVTVTCSHTGGYNTIPAATSTCTVQGNNEYYQCKVCNKYFADTALKNETTPDAQLLELAAHTTQWTYDEAGHQQWCTECRNYIGEKTGHSLEWVEDYPAVPGVSDGQKHEECKTCGYTKDAEKICAHINTTVVGAKEAKCNEDGYTGDTVCVDCQQTLTYGSAITERPEHTPELVNAKEASCTEAGYTGDTVCSACHEVLENGREIAKTEHEFKDGVCIHCGLKESEPPVDTGDSTVILVMSTILVAGVAIVICKKRKEAAE